MEKFNLNNVSKFEFIKPVNKEFSLFKCWVAGVGKNRNMSYISKERMTAALPTLSYAPVVGHLIKNEDGTYRLGSHDTEFDMETWEFVPLTVPVGVVIADSFSYETVNEYGTDVEYLTANLILWTGRYPELFDCKYSDEIFCAQSMELAVNQYRILEEDSNYTELLDFSFSALCLLGKSDNPELNNEPCFISSRLEPINFSSNDFVAKFNELKEAVKECFDTEEEGEVNVAENMTMELETEEIVETETEIVEETTEEVAEVDETTKEEAAEEEVTVDYEAKYNDALSEIETLKAQVAELTQSVETLTPYKLAAEKVERENAENDVFAKYDSRIGEMAEYAELKTKAGEYSIADLERECLILVGKFAMTETKTEEVEPETEPTITFALDETVETKPSRYSDIYETYKSR
jgi:outer membrane murein-binding lipoprotein Lpp